MARSLEEYEGKLADTVERFSASSSMQTDAALQTVNNNSMATGKLTAVLERIEGTMAAIGSAVLGVHQGQQRLEAGTLQIADGLVASQQRLGDCTLQLAERVVSAQQRLEAGTQELGTGMLSAVAAFSDSTAKSAEVIQQFSVTNQRALTMLEFNQAQMNSLVQQNQQTAHYLRGVSTILTGTTPQLLDDISRPHAGAMVPKVTMAMPPPLSPAVLYQQQRQQQQILLQQQQQQQMSSSGSSTSAANPGLPSPAVPFSPADISSLLSSRPELGQLFLAFLAQKSSPSNGGENNLPPK
jgi:hypothetical protein